MSEIKNIIIKPETHKILKLFQIKNDFKTFDEAIYKLLESKKDGSF